MCSTPRPLFYYTTRTEKAEEDYHLKLSTMHVDALKHRDE